MTTMNTLFDANAKIKSVEDVASLVPFQDVVTLRLGLRGRHHHQSLYLGNQDGEHPTNVAFAYKLNRGENTVIVRANQSVFALVVNPGEPGLRFRKPAFNNELFGRGTPEYEKLDGYLQNLGALEVRS